LVFKSKPLGVTPTRHWRLADFAEPSFALGLDDAVFKVTSYLVDPCSLYWVKVGEASIGVSELGRGAW
jgi:hypothetical protein